MSIIQVLDQNTINQIAAGEVIERPSAVVKELTENAIDAGASAITVEVKEGGIAFIRVTDNGKGISKDDIRQAFLRHATSKIRTAEDLLHVSSLGFRGEALSSIAAISQVELITKTADDFTGYRYVIEGGEEGSNGDHGLEPVGCPEGSTFLIRNLFYNTPARKKFLKTPATEAGYIQDVMEHMAVSHPEIAVKFILNGQTKIQTPGNGNQKDVIYYLYGREIAANVVEVQEEFTGMKIHGYIGKPVITRGNRNYENYFLNGRYIKNPVVNRAIEDAYKPYIMQHRYPFTSLMIQVPPETIDVNVHPAKLEVRFRNTEALYQLVYHAVSSGLRSREQIPAVRPGKEEPSVIPSIPKPAARPEPFEAKRNQTVKTEAVHYVQENLFRSEIKEEETSPLVPKLSGAVRRTPIVEPPKVEPLDFRKEFTTGYPPVEAAMLAEESSYSTKMEEPKEVQKEEQKEKQKEDQERRFLSEEARSRHRIIGQLFATYWLFEYEDQFYMLDQHAAHEKVLYERTMKRLAERQMESQNLMPPIILTLSAREEIALAEIGAYLTQAGFEIEHFGGREYALSAVPVDLFHMAGGDMMTAILDDYLESGKTQAPEMILERVATMSCKAAVKGNMHMTEKEAQALMDELMTLENPYNCPHGRPTMISMSKYEIEKKFKRIV